MKIATSQVSVTNDYQHKSASARQVSMVKQAKVGQTTVDISSTQKAQLKLMASTGLDVEAGQLPQLLPQSAIQGKDNNDSDDLNNSAYYEKGIYVMKLLLERMSGKKIQMFDTQRFMNQANETNERNNNMGLGQGNGQGNRQEKPGDLMRVTEYQYEKQSNQLQFSGSIELENGEQHKFAFGVSFSQEYESISTQVMKREELKDPLVISFSTNPVTLSNKKFNFDIDADNQKDSIAMLGAGSGFLALDRNGDNKINNGTELFGALSGNGFADLAAYDQDQNGFIDEKDDIFSDLSVWIKNEGEDKLVSLKDTNIGAIALENVDTPLTIRDGDDKLGLIRKSGFYLNNDGTPGLIQQLDFVV
jgi:hypothetical protein